MPFLQLCPNCRGENTYPSGELMTCPDCFNEWNPATEADSAEMIEDGDPKVVDAHGQALQNGDTVMVIKDLPVKGSLRPVKAGTKVKNIRLKEGDHNIDCRIDGFGSMALKSEFVKKI